MLHLVANRKGGVGKTTVTLYLAGAVAVQTGKPCLILDTDPQSNVGMLMGYPKEIAKIKSLTTILEDDRNPYECVLESDEFIGCHVVLAGHLQPEGTLHNAYLDKMVWLLDALSKLPYQHIFVDTPPVLSGIHLLCLRAADSLIVPTQPSYLALEGVKFLLETIHRECLRENFAIPATGILLNQRHPQNSTNTKVEAAFRQVFKELMYEAVIPYSHWFDSCAVKAESVLERAKGNTKVVEAFHGLAAEFLNRLSRRPVTPNS